MHHSVQFICVMLHLCNYYICVTLYNEVEFINIVEYIWYHELAEPLKWQGDGKKKMKCHIQCFCVLSQNFCVHQRKFVFTRKTCDENDGKITCISVLLQASAKFLWGTQYFWNIKRFLSCSGKSSAFAKHWNIIFIITISPWLRMNY